MVRDVLGFSFLDDQAAYTVDYTELSSALSDIRVHTLWKASLKMMVWRTCTSVWNRVWRPQCPLLCLRYVKCYWCTHVCKWPFNLHLHNELIQTSRIYLSVPNITPHKGRNVTVS